MIALIDSHAMIADRGLSLQHSNHVQNQGCI